MKKALIVLMLAASTSVFAQSVTSSRNLSGGENFWLNGRYLGSTTRNLAGGRNFYPSHELQMRQRAFQSQQRMQSIRERRRLRGADNWDWSK